MALFIFRRDYRIQDNLGLTEALREHSQVIPIFIFTPEQIEPKQNPYFSNNAVEFMVKSLEDLDAQLQAQNSRLRYFYGPPDRILETLLSSIPIEAVHVNQDYSPYSKARDATLDAVCQAHNVAFHSYHDALLQPVGSVRTVSGKVYQKFTPFYRASKTDPSPKANSSLIQIGFSTPTFQCSSTSR